ncbi:MAG: HMA2 domain-containing protein [Candidatus Hydrogenedentota bacterium]
MHIITGIVLMELARRLRTPGGTPLPQLNVGPLQTAHALPGRLRLRIPSLRDDARGVALLRTELPRLEGVRRVEVTPFSGSVLIHYEPGEVQDYLLLSAAARLLGIEDALTRTGDPWFIHEAKEITGALNQAVYHRTYGLMDLRSLVPLILVYLGIRDLWARGWQNKPGGITLLWWAWHSLASPSPGRHP